MSTNCAIRPRAEGDQRPHGCGQSSACLGDSGWAGPDEAPRWPQHPEKTLEDLLGAELRAPQGRREGKRSGDRLLCETPGQGGSAAGSWAGSVADVPSGRTW